jgi:ABC-2 type transport system ATP-binding protein
VEPAIQLISVSKTYGGIEAVSGVNLTVHPGELVGLVGPDGSGKSTLARLAAGVLAPTAGRVEPDSRGRVGYLSSRFSLYPELTVWENLDFFASVYGMSRSQIAAEGARLLAWVGLLPFRDRLSGALSGGMRQKLSLVCSVIHQPPILILDEPTTAVDPVARTEFWGLLREQAGLGRALLITTPYLDEAEFCHRVGLLQGGRLMATGTAAELKGRLPYRMALLEVVGERAVRRAELQQVAASIQGQCWIQPMGSGVRIAMKREAPILAPPGFSLTAVAPTLEDTYVWLAEQREGVSSS